MRIASAAEITNRLAGRTEALILCGHTHLPRSVRIGGQLVVNPGSVGLPAFDDERPHFHKVENGVPDARYAIIERTITGWSASLIAVPYDWPCWRKNVAFLTGPALCAQVICQSVLMDNPTCVVPVISQPLISKASSGSTITNNHYHHALSHSGNN